MKRLISVGIAAAALCSAPAFAADMPVKAPAVPASYSWTGFYLGAGGGYGSWVDPKSTVSGIGFAAIDQAQAGKGGFATAIAGFDYQFADRWVAGAYADFDLSAIDGATHNFNLGNYTGARDIRRAWFGGGRVGYLLMPSSLLYATGGYTEAHFPSAVLHQAVGPPFSGLFGDNFLPGNSSHGWYVGAGLETQIVQGWSLRGEYRYADYGTVRLTEALVGQNNYSLHPTVQTFRVDLAYKFGQQPAAAPRTARIVAPWSGFYLGAGGGYGSWEDPHTIYIAQPVPGIYRVDIPSGGKGGLVSLISGYDHQFADRIVAGVYTDYDFARIKGVVNNDFHATVTPYTENHAWFAGARVGYLLMPSALAYATGGYTSAHFSAGQTFAALAPSIIVPVLQTPAKTFNGWYLGGGLETRIDQNWSIRGEYRYASYDRETLTNPVGEAVQLHPAVQTYRVDLIYKFATP